MGEIIPLMTKLHHGQYVHLDILPDGNLRVTLTEEGLREEQENRHKDASDDDVLSDLYTENDSMSRPDSNGGPLFLNNIETLDGGHMSQAPVFVTEWDLNVDEYGHQRTDLPDYVTYVTTEHSRVWYWSDYCIISILEHIKEHDQAVLTRLQ